MPDDELDELDDLYQDTLLDYYENLCCYGPLKPGDIVVEHENPLCGDMIQLGLHIVDNKIVHIQWYGRGCVISQSSASMMAEYVKNQPIEKVLDLSQQVIQMLRGESYYLPEEYREELESLKGVMKFPVRVKCASLAWNVIQDAIQKKTG